MLSVHGKPPLSFLFWELLRSHSFSLFPFSTVHSFLPASYAPTSTSARLAGGFRIATSCFATRRWSFFGDSEWACADLSGSVEAWKRQRPSHGQCQVARRLPAASQVRYPAPFALETEDRSRQEL